MLIARRQNRGELYARHYRRMGEDSGHTINSDSSLKELEDAYDPIRRTANQVVIPKQYLLVFKI